MKTMANEFSTNLINIKVHNHRNENEKHVTYSVLNPAEVIAMKAEQARLEEEMQKRMVLEEGMRKTKENIKIYKNGLKEKEELNKKNEEDKKSKKDKIKEYNEQLRKKVINKKKEEENNENTENIKKIENINENYKKEDYATFSDNNEVEKEEKLPTPMSKASIHHNLNSHLNENTNVVDIRDDIDKLIREKIESVTKIQENNNKTNPQVVQSVRSNFSNYSDTSKISKINTNINVTEELNKNIDCVKDFRKTGIISINKTKENKNINTNKNNEEYDENDDPKNNKKNNKNISNNTKKCELEKRRYVKALKNLMIEKFKEKSIVIPNICSCGQLQRKLDTLLEDKNVSIYSIINIECANNCIYYKNNSEYHKALSDVINSVKNLKYDSFNTK